MQRNAGARMAQVDYFQETSGPSAYAPPRAVADASKRAKPEVQHCPVCSAAMEIRVAAKSGNDYYKCPDRSCDKVLFPKKFGWGDAPAPAPAPTQAADGVDALRRDLAQLSAVVQQLQARVHTLGQL